MVVIQVKRSDTDVFLVESTITESNDALVRRLVSAKSCDELGHLEPSS